jgi:single-strand DNA-binding protein
MFLILAGKLFSARGYINMAGSVNKVILIGNLGRDPEVRSTQDGSKIVSFSVATSETWKDKITGERKDRVEWHRIVVFNPNICDLCEKYLHKGSKVYLEGQLQTRRWQDQAGVERFTTEVVIPRFRGEIGLLDSKSDSGGASIIPDDHQSAASIAADDVPF